MIVSRNKNNHNSLMYRDPVPKNSWVLLTGGGGGQGPPCRNAYGHIIESSDLKRCTANVSILIHLHLAFIPMQDFYLLFLLLFDTNLVKNKSFLLSTKDL